MDNFFHITLIDNEKYYKKYIFKWYNKSELKTLINKFIDYFDKMNIDNNMVLLIKKIKDIYPELINSKKFRKYFFNLICNRDITFQNIKFFNLIFKIIDCDVNHENIIKFINNSNFVDLQILNLLKYNFLNINIKKIIHLMDLKYYSYIIQINKFDINILLNQMRTKIDNVKNEKFYITITNEIFNNLLLDIKVCKKINLELLNYLLLMKHNNFVYYFIKNIILIMKIYPKFIQQNIKKLTLSNNILFEKNKKRKILLLLKYIYINNNKIFKLLINDSIFYNNIIYNVLINDKQNINILNVKCDDYDIINKFFIFEWNFFENYLFSIGKSFLFDKIRNRYKNNYRKFVEKTDKSDLNEYFISKFINNGYKIFIYQNVYSINHINFFTRYIIKKNITNLGDLNVIDNYIKNNKNKISNMLIDFKQIMKENNVLINEIDEMINKYYIDTNDENYLSNYKSKLINMYNKN